MSLVVRPARPEDAVAAARAMRASIAKLCAADHAGDADLIAAWTANKTAAHFRRWLASPTTRVFVAELDGRLAAVGAVSTAGEVLLAAGCGGGARGACVTQARAPASRRQAASCSSLRSASFLCSARCAMFR